MSDKDIHSHKCEDCGHIWTHERLVGATDREYEKVHECSNCTKVQYLKYYGPGSIQEGGPSSRDVLEFLFRMLDLDDRHENGEMSHE